MFRDTHALDVVGEDRVLNTPWTRAAQAFVDRHTPAASILVPLDGSLFAEQALAPAAVLAQALAARLILLRAIPSMQAWMGESIEVAEPFERVAARLREKAEAYLKARKSEWHHLGAPIEVETVCGSPAEAILDYADWARVDLIILCMRRYSGLRRWFHGQIAQKILRDARCPTLMVMDDDTRDQQSALHILQVRQAMKVTKRACLGVNVRPGSAMEETDARHRF
jgi:nucleotide-binding universal stress UspA family protein